jgi:hypothetical protein
VVQRTAFSQGIFAFAALKKHDFSKKPPQARFFMATLPNCAPLLIFPAIFATCFFNPPAAFAATYTFITQPIFMPAMLRILPLFLACFFQTLALSAQVGCPGCVTQVNPAFPADTLYLQPIPDGVIGTAYDQDISFRMPKTTTPVNAVDSTTPAGLPISKLEILGVDGLPPGLFWQPNQFVFETATQTDGCIKICGTPLTSDSFILNVRLKATVFIINQETSFPLKMYVGPKVSITEGFTMQNFSGCAPLTTTFTNNVPSNGQPGFSYKWDFGDGTLSVSEMPGTHTYTAAGSYPVHYEAIVDTNGYRLESVTILDVDCVDQLGLGTPDLYVQIFDANGVLVYDSSPDVENADLPLTLPVGLLLSEQNYTLKVIDEDGGLKGGDDDCGTVSFNRLSGGTLVSGGLTLQLSISHLTDTIRSVDTVTVFAVPTIPVFTNNLNLLCLTDTTGFPSDSLQLQWTLAGEDLENGREACFCATESGIYTLYVSNQFGCASTYSLPVLIDSNADCTLAAKAPVPSAPLPMFPNPSTGLFRIPTDPTTSATCRVWDAMGRMVWEGQRTSGATNMEIDLRGQASGLYMVVLQQGNQSARGRAVLLR